MRASLLPKVSSLFHATTLAPGLLVHRILSFFLSLYLFGGARHLRQPSGSVGSMLNLIQLPGRSQPWAYRSIHCSKTSRQFCFFSSYIYSDMKGFDSALLSRPGRVFSALQTASHHTPVGPLTDLCADFNLGHNICYFVPHSKESECPQLLFCRNDNMLVARLCLLPRDDPASPFFFSSPARLASCHALVGCEFR